MRNLRDKLTVSACHEVAWAAKIRFGSHEHGDTAEAMNAAKQIGDDTLQRNAGRVPQRHSFTQGTSEQRQRWFPAGYQSGEISDCDTFGADQL